MQGTINIKRFDSSPVGMQSERHKTHITVHFINLVLRRHKSKPYIIACLNKVRIRRTRQSEQETTLMGLVRSPLQSDAFL